MLPLPFGFLVLFIFFFAFTLFMLSSGLSNVSWRGNLPFVFPLFHSLTPSLQAQNAWRCILSTTTTCGRRKKNNGDSIILYDLLSGEVNDRVYGYHRTFLHFFFRQKVKTLVFIHIWVMLLGIQLWSKLGLKLCCFR